MRSQGTSDFAVVILLPLLIIVNIDEDRGDLLDHFPLLEGDSPVAGAGIQNVVWCHVPLHHHIDHDLDHVVDDVDHDENA